MTSVGQRTQHAPNGVLLSKCTGGTTAPALTCLKPFAFSQAPAPRLQKICPRPRHCMTARTEPDECQQPSRCKHARSGPHHTGTTRYMLTTFLCYSLTYDSTTPHSGPSIALPNCARSFLDFCNRRSHPVRLSRGQNDRDCKDSDVVGGHVGRVQQSLRKTAPCRQTWPNAHALTTHVPFPHHFCTMPVWHTCRA